MSESLPQPNRAERAFAQARDLAAELGRPGDPVTEIPLAMPTRPGSTAPSSERNAYKNIEEGVTKRVADIFDNDVEGAMVMRDLAPFLRGQSAMNQEGVEHKDKMAKVRGLSDYQYLLTHFVLERSDDEAYMRRFWQSAETLAKKDGKSEQNVTQLRVGILSTVATIKALELLGYEPELAHPAQDAYDAIDVWTGARKALQVKGAGDQLQVYRTEDVGFPAVRVKESGQPAKMISTGSTQRLEGDLYKFAAKVDQVSEREGRPVEGLLVVIPYSRINHATGEPSTHLIEELRFTLAESDYDAAA